MEGAIILFDGVCNLCSQAVQFVIKRDKKKLFRFASLQSEDGCQLLTQFGLPQDQTDSFVLILNGRSYIKSDATLKVASMLSYPTKILTVFVILPKMIRDWVYDLIARNRYRFFGRKNHCLVPTPELKKRFIN